MERLKELILAVLNGEFSSDWVIPTILSAYVHGDITLEQRKTLVRNAWLCGILDKLVKLAESGSSPPDKAKMVLSRQLSFPATGEEKLLEDFERSGRDSRLLIGIAAELGPDYKEVLARRVEAHVA